MLVDVTLYKRTGTDKQRVRLPATTEEMGTICSWLDGLRKEDTHIEVTESASPVRNLDEIIRKAEIDIQRDIRRLNDLAEKIDGMSEKEQDIFSGVLQAEAVHGLDDILHAADDVKNYILLPNIDTEWELGEFLVNSGYKDFPDSVLPYLHYANIGAEYLEAQGGFFTECGYIRRKSSVEQQIKDRSALITLHLSTLEAPGNTGKNYCLSLPATDEELDMAKAAIGVDYFTEATITKVEFGKPYLEELIPQDCFCVEDANELALGIEEMQQRDGELLKYMSVLSVVQPETLADALQLAIDLDDYERVTENVYEYGEQALRRIGADDEIIGAIENYMDFEKLGEDAMAEDGVRQTEFGLIRRISEPFPEETQGQEFGGM